jgi:DUF4097 and DUF4098 domain-containing protein YvlB
MAGRGLVIIAVGAGLLMLGACGWTGRNTENDDATVDQSFGSVRIANDSGQVKIHAGAQAKVHRTIHFDDRKPGNTFRVENNTLVIESCKERNCSIDYDITVPAGTKVDGAISSGSVELDGVTSVNLKADSGRVSMRHISGKVNLDSSSGSVHIEDADDAVAVRSDSGRVTVDGAAGAVSVHAESGSVEALKVGGAVEVRSESGSVTAALTSPQNVKISADSGSVTVTVPRDGAYKLAAYADSGNVNSDVTNDSSGSHSLDLHTDSGNITVRRA